MTNALMDLLVRVEPAPSSNRTAAGTPDSSDSGAAFAKAVDQAVSESRSDRAPVDRHSSDHERPGERDSKSAPDDRSATGSEAAAAGRVDGAKDTSHRDGKDDRHDKGSKNDGAADAGIAAFWAALSPSHPAATATTGAAATAKSPVGTATSSTVAVPGLPNAAGAAASDAGSKPAHTEAAHPASVAPDPRLRGNQAPDTTTTNHTLTATTATAATATATTATAATATATTPTATTAHTAAASPAATTPDPRLLGPDPAGGTNAANTTAAGAVAAVAARAAATAAAGPATTAPDPRVLSHRAPDTTTTNHTSARADATTLTAGARAGSATATDHRIGSAASATGGAHADGGANGGGAAGSSYPGQTAGAQLAPTSIPAPTPVAATVNSTPVPTQAPTPTPFAQAQPNVAAILAQLRGTADGSYQLRAQVHPAELGAVAISATVHHGALTVTLTPDQTAQQTIAQSLPQLRQHLADQGFTGVNVGLGFSSQPGSSGQGSDRDDRAQGSDHSALQGMDTAIGAVDPAAPTSRIAGASSALDRML